MIVPGRWTAPAAVALAVVISDSASAQLTPKQPEATAVRGETVQTRARPELQPLGIRAGSFLIFPALGLDETYNDNVFATRSHEIETDGNKSKNNKKSDLVTDVKPEISVESDWANHALNFKAGADSGVYSQYSRLDYNDWFVSGDGRLDITRNAAFFAGGGFAHEHEDPGAPDAPSSAKQVTEYDLTTGFARYIQKFGRFNATGEGAVVRTDYDKTNTFSGDELTNTARDITVYSGGGRLGYELVPHYEAYVKVEGNDRHYDTNNQPGTENDIERNSQGYTAVTGVALDLGGVLFGDVYAGYLAQYFNDSTFDNVSTFTAGGTLTWNVTTLTTLNARAARLFQDTIQTGSPGIIRTTGGVSADHELLRNLILSASMTVTNDNYIDNNRNDYYYIPGIGARYLMNRNVYANIGYQFIHHTTNGSDTHGQQLRSESHPDRSRGAAVTASTKADGRALASASCRRAGWGASISRSSDQDQEDEAVGSRTSSTVNDRREDDETAEQV